MVSWLNVGVKGGAIWPTQEAKVTFGGHELILRPATKDTEQSIHIALGRITDIEALTLINRFLSVLTWCDEQGMENLYGWSGNPVPVNVPRSSRVVGSSIMGFPFNRNLGSDPKAKLALALYREARTINSGSFEFLDYFKILNIFWEDKYRNGQNQIIEGIRKILPQLTDQQATDRIKALNKQTPDVSKYLYESGRCAIAHAYASPIVDPDDVTDLRRLSQDVWVVRAIAEHLIENELGVSRSILG